MGFTGYELLDSGEGRRLEQFGEYILDRPDPQIIWQKMAPEKWDLAHAVYQRTTEDRGQWLKKRDMPETWQMTHKSMTIEARLTPFKHTGIFPEQSEQWAWMQQLITGASSSLSVLSLFGYTGTAALQAAQAGAKVTYVDASKSALSWARKNQELSKLTDKPIRWILDDVMKYVQREVKREVKYDAIIMDPPAFGHGPSGETWQFNKSLPELLALCSQILTPNPKFILINAYAISSSAYTLGNVLHDLMSPFQGEINTGELVLNQTGTSRVLSTGIWGSWESKQ